MSTTDSIADMLTRIRNANTANKETVSMPSSRKLVEIARIMKEEGYIAEYEIISKAPQDELFITLKYGDKKEKVIRGLRRISKPAFTLARANCPAFWVVSALPSFPRPKVS